jgi:hypothetical protein
LFYSVSGNANSMSNSNNYENNITQGAKMNSCVGCGRSPVCAEP